MNPRDMHPESLRKTLARLAPDRPPTPWDAKIERLLNGCRDPHLYIGRTLDDGSPCLLDRRLLSGHGHYLGGSGSGKTALGVAPHSSQLIAHGDSSVVVIDMKGDNALFWGSFIEAERAGLPFRWFTIEPGAASFAFNPFTQKANQSRSVSALAEYLLIALGLYFGEAYGKSYFQSIALDTITAFLTKFPDIRSFADFARYAEEPGSHAAAGTDYEGSQHLRMLVRQLAAVTPLNATASTKPAVNPSVIEHAIDAIDVVTRPQVVYFSLPSLEQELTAKSVGRLALYAIVQAAKIVSRTRRTVPTYVVVDEFQQICAENLKILLEMARSMGVYLLLSHQDISQLKTADYDITSTVESSTTFKCYFESSSLNSMRQLEEYSGEFREPSLSWSQRIPPGVDDNDDSAFSLARAYPRTEFGPPLATISERVRFRLTRNEILAVSAHPLQCFVRFRADRGLTQYAGQWTKIECEFPIPFDEYKARLETPLPTEHPACVVVEGRKDEEAQPTTGLPNRPLPVTPPSKAVDHAIAARLRELQDEIRGGNGRPGERRPGA